MDFSDLPFKDKLDFWRKKEQEAIRLLQNILFDKEARVLRLEEDNPILTILNDYISLTHYDNDLMLKDNRNTTKDEFKSDEYRSKILDLFLIVGRIQTNNTRLILIFRNGSPVFIRYYGTATYLKECNEPISKLNCNKPISKLNYNKPISKIDCNESRINLDYNKPISKLNCNKPLSKLNCNESRINLDYNMSRINLDYNESISTLESIDDTNALDLNVNIFDKTHKSIIYSPKDKEVISELNNSDPFSGNYIIDDKKPKKSIGYKFRKSLYTDLFCGICLKKP